VRVEAGEVVGVSLVSELADFDSASSFSESLEDAEEDASIVDDGDSWTLD
jgi:hypothetical protein